MSLRDIVGEAAGDLSGIAVAAAAGGGAGGGGEDVAAAMAAAEEDADINAGRRAAQEATAELAEFDDSAPIAVSTEEELGDGDAASAAPASAAGVAAAAGDGGGDAAGMAAADGGAAAAGGGGAPADKKVAAEEDEVDRMLREDAARAAATAEDDAGAAAEARVAALASRLRPVERYALRFREVGEPHPALRPEVLAAAAAAFDAGETEWQVEQLRALAEDEEQKAEADTELINLGRGGAPDGGVEGGVRVAAAIYAARRAALRRERAMRAVTGECWYVTAADEKAGVYRNADTGDVVEGGPPPVLVDNEARVRAAELGWRCLMPNVLLHVLRFVAPAERLLSAGLVCKAWWRVATSPQLFLRVAPARVRAVGAAHAAAGGGGGGAGGSGASGGDSLVFATITDALLSATAGDTIALSVGSYYEPRLVLAARVRLVTTADATDPLASLRAAGAAGAAVHDVRGRAAEAAAAAVAPMPPCAHCAYGFVPGGVLVPSSDRAVIRMDGPLEWLARGGLVEAVALRNTRGLRPGAVVVARGCRADLRQCDISVFGGPGACVAVAAEDAEAVLVRCMLIGGAGPGVLVGSGGVLAASECRVRLCGGHGVELLEHACAVVTRCSISGCEGAAVAVRARSIAAVSACDLRDNRRGAFEHGGGEVRDTGNTVVDAGEGDGAAAGGRRVRMRVVFTASNTS